MRKLYIVGIGVGCTAVGFGAGMFTMYKIDSKKLDKIYNEGVDYGKAEKLRAVEPAVVPGDSGEGCEKDEEGNATPDECVLEDVKSDVYFSEAEVIHNRPTDIQEAEDLTDVDAFDRFGDDTSFDPELDMYDWDDAE